MPNAEELEVMEMTHDQEKRLKDLEKRVKALETTADEKEGRPSEAGHTKAEK